MLLSCSFTPHAKIGFGFEFKIWKKKDLKKNGNKVNKV